MLRLRWRHDLPELTTLADLERVLESGQSGRVFLYKHSLTCGTSAYALEEMTQLAAAEPDVPLHLVPVQTARAVSDAIANRFGLRHESPQLILVDHGQVRWHASHFGVTAERAREALGA